MNTQLKTVLLTILTLSVFVIALVELSGVSSTALFNKYNIDVNGDHSGHKHAQVEAAKHEAEEMKKTEITFDETKHSFGTINEGEKVKHAYTFTNTGSQPLLIAQAVASCGCTVPNYPKKPIKPGGRGEIVVEFNSADRLGHQQKSVLIHYNGINSPIAIGFDAEVVK